MEAQLKDSVSLTPAQANSISRALNILTRLGLGQMDCIDHAIRDDLLLVRGSDSFREADMETCERVRFLMDQFQNGLGFSTNASFGIFNKEVPVVAQRAWEIKKILDKALAEDRNPNPSFRGVNYDGLSVRCTREPIPGVELVHASEGDANTLESVKLFLTPEQHEALKKAVHVTRDLMEARYEVLSELVEEGVIPFNNDVHWGCPPQDIPFFQKLVRALTQQMTSPLKNRDAQDGLQGGFELPSL